MMLTNWLGKHAAKVELTPEERQILEQQRAIHEAEQRREAERTDNSAPVKTANRFLRRGVGSSDRAKYHPAGVTAVKAALRQEPHFVATHKGFLVVDENGGFKTTANPRMATTFQTFGEADSVAKKACKELYDVRSQYYAVFVKP